MFKRNPNRYWLFPILLLTIVFVLFGIYSCRTTNEQFHQDNADSLTYISSSLSDALVFGNALSVEIASIPELKTLGQLDELKGTSMLDLKTVSNILVRTADINHMVESVYIHFTRSGKVLTQDTLYDLHDFYDRAILMQCEEDDLAFWYGCRRVDAGDLTYVEPVNVLTIIRRIPVEVFSADDPVVVNLNIDELLHGHSRYEQVFLISGDAVVGASEHQDKADLLQTELDASALAGSKGMLTLPSGYLYYQKLDASAIYCATLTPKAQLINANLPAISILLLMYLASLLVFFLLMRLFASLTAKRSQDLIRKIGDGTGHPIPEEEDPTATLDDMINRLVTTNRQMTESEKKYATLIQSTVIADIIRGHIESEEKLAEHLAYCNLHFEHPHFTGFVCLTTIDDTQLQNDATTAYSVTLFIKDLIERELSADYRIYFHTALDNKIYFFINHDTSYETLQALLNASLHRVNVLAQSDYDVSLLFFTGPCVDSVTKVAHSCHTARRLSDTHQPSDAASTSEAPASPHHLPAYPAAIAEQLMGGFKKGSREMVCKGLRTYFDDYLLPAQLPLDMCKNITCILVTNILSEKWISNQEIHLGEMLTHLASMADVATMDGLRQTTEELLMSMLDQHPAAEMNSGYISKYIPTVTEYMKNNYYKDLSIADIAACVDLNPRYLGELFKEATGQTLIQHLNAIRIDCAKRLLRETDTTIREIAEKIGYNGIHTFIRHFKALNNGVTPTEYRSAHADE